MLLRQALTSIFILASAAPIVAQEFVRVTEQDDFLALVSGNELTRLGIRLIVTADGVISGSAFGQDVTGDWVWEDGYFCRNLVFGSSDLGPNCQVVLIEGATLRFIADKGTGDQADLELQPR